MYQISFNDDESWHNISDDNFIESTHSLNYSCEATAQEFKTLSSKHLQARGSLASFASPEEKLSESSLSPAELAYIVTPSISSSLPETPQTPASQPALCHAFHPATSFVAPCSEVQVHQDLVMPALTANIDEYSHAFAGSCVGRLRISVCEGNSNAISSLVFELAKSCPDLLYFNNTALGSEQSDLDSDSFCLPNKTVQASGNNRSISVLTENLGVADTSADRLLDNPKMCQQSVLRYMETQFDRTDVFLHDSYHLGNREITKLISSPSDAFTHVDVVLFCLSKSIQSTELEYMRKLSRFTSVVPLLTKSYCSQDLSSLRRLALSQLKHAQCEIFDFCSSDTSTIDNMPELPIVVSCASCCEAANLEETCIQELTDPPDRSLLRILSCDNIRSRLRLSTAKKFLHWKFGVNPLVQSPNYLHGISQKHSADFTISKIAEHTAIEEEKNKAKLQDYVLKMMQSFQGQNPCNYTINERSAEWIVARLEDYATKGVQNRRTSLKSYKKVYCRDPLGFLAIRQTCLKQFMKAFVILCKLGLTGLLGNVAYRFYYDVRQDN